MEIAKCVSSDLTKAMTSSSMVIGLSINEELAKFFTQHHGQVVRYGGRMLKIMKKNDWLVTPPIIEKKLELV